MIDYELATQSHSRQQTNATRSTHPKGPAIDDNRMIYIETVPPVESLAPVGKAALVKPIAPEFESSDIKPLFNGLLPRFVMEEVETHKVE